MHRFKEISINIQDSFFFGIVFDKPTKYINIYMYYIYRNKYIQRERNVKGQDIKETF